MGVGIEMIFFLGLFLFAAFIVYRLVFSKRSKIRLSDFTQPGSTLLRWTTISVGVLLIILVALTLEFCSEQQHRMDKNTHEDNALDNVGKGENEADDDDDKSPDKRE
jgi:uncharacterized membrane protein